MADVQKIVFSFFQSKGTILGETQLEKLSCQYLEEKLIDSMGLVDMIMEFEATLGISFEPKHIQANEFRTVGGLIEIIEKLIKEQNA